MLPFLVITLGYTDSHTAALRRLAPIPGYHFGPGHAGCCSGTQQLVVTSSILLLLLTGMARTAVILLVVAWLKFQQHASVSQGRICSDNCTCCHTETEVAAQNICLTQSQYTDTGPTSPSANPRQPGAESTEWQGSYSIFFSNLCNQSDLQ